jgi:hypothetical protein
MCSHIFFQYFGPSCVHIFFFFFFLLLHSLLSYLKNRENMEHLFLWKTNDMFLHTSSIEAAHICDVYVILILGA